MTDEVISKLPEVLRGHICTLKRASGDTTNNEYMCESGLKVINFDKIPDEYARGKGWTGVPKSNDALYIDMNENWFFIEFKNGKIVKDDIYRKIYDSLIMLIEWRIIPDFEFVREHIDYILVYNGDKFKKIPPSQGREQTYGYFMELAQQEEKLFNIDKFEKYLFHKTHTYTKHLFEKYFIQTKEQEEREVS